MAQLLGVDFSLNNLWRVCHRAELQPVDVLPVVDLGEKQAQEMSFAVISTMCVAPLLCCSDSRRIRKGRETPNSIPRDTSSPQTEKQSVRGRLNDRDKRHIESISLCSGHRKHTVHIDSHSNAPFPTHREGESHPQ